MYGVFYRIVGVVMAKESISNKGNDVWKYYKTTLKIFYKF